MAFTDLIPWGCNRSLTAPRFGDDSDRQIFCRVGIIPIASIAEIFDPLFEIVDAFFAVHKAVISDRV